MNSHIKLAALRVLGAFKGRIDYPNFTFGLSQKMTRYYWSLQTNFSCNYDCSYCVQGFGLDGGRNDLPQHKMTDPEVFLQINRIAGVLPEKVECLVIQGGEPLLYKKLPFLLENLKVFKKIIIVSNLALDLGPYIQLKKDGRCAADLEFIGSYHSRYSRLEDFMGKALLLKDAGMLEHCDIVDDKWATSIEMLDAFKRKGIPLKLYNYVGKKDGLIYPVKATEACSGKRGEKVLCHSVCVLLSPDGKIYNCHAKMYRNSGAVCTIGEFPEKFVIGYFPCDEYGSCQPCQAGAMKIKKVGR